MSPIDLAFTILKEHIFIGNPIHDAWADLPLTYVDDEGGMDEVRHRMIQQGLDPQSFDRAFGPQDEYWEGDEHYWPDPEHRQIMEQILRDYGNELHNEMRDIDPNFSLGTVSADEETRRWQEINKRQP